MRLSNVLHGRTTDSGSDRKQDLSGWASGKCHGNIIAFTTDDIATTRLCIRSWGMPLRPTQLYASILDFDGHIPRSSCLNF